MNIFSAVAALRELERSQWRDREKLHRLQTRKLRKIIDHTYATVPYYRSLFDDAGIAPADIRTIDDLQHVPVTTKADLRDAGLDATLSFAYKRDSLMSEHTSGSSGTPFRVWFDPHWVDVRNGLFLRALASTGYRLGRKLMLMTSERTRTPGPWMRWKYSSIADSPRRALVRLNLFRPWLLYGCMTPLRELAMYVQEAGASVYRPHAIASTAEALDPVTRRLLEGTFGVTVYDLYGLTEMGMVGRECAMHTGYHVSEDTTIVEYLPTPGHESLHRLVMTNLDLYAMPFVRYDTGDLGTPAAPGDCGCGRTSVRLAHVDGRTVDCVRLRDGQLISPYRLTLALERVPRIDRYQIVQESYDDFTVRLEGRRSEDGLIEDAARSAVAGVVGRDARVRIHHENTLDPPPGGKFRVVESRVAGGGSGPGA